MQLFHWNKCVNTDPTPWTYLHLRVYSEVSNKPGGGGGGERNMREGADRFFEVIQRGGMKGSKMDALTSQVILYELCRITRYYLVIEFNYAHEEWNYKVLSNPKYNLLEIEPCNSIKKWIKKIRAFRHYKKHNFPWELGLRSAKNRIYVSMLLRNKFQTKFRKFRDRTL